MTWKANNDRKPAGRASAPALLLGAALVAAAGALAYWQYSRAHRDGQASDSPFTLEEIPFNGARAYDYLKRLCAIGPRPSGSPGMTAQQELLAAHFQKLGGQVALQRFSIPHPLDRSTVPMANLVVHWHPQRQERILLCAHYDTLPFPLRDPENKRGTFVGANDNASGVAILMELAHDIPTMRLNYGIDFVLLDGEEFVFHEQGWYFWGSDHFARQYVGTPPPYRYRWGVLLDMVGCKNLQLYQEGNSLFWPDTRPLVESVWDTAKRLGVREFIPKKMLDIQDDHLMLHNIGKIPCIDIIADFSNDYPAWHTQADTPDQCSALSLAKVGWVIRAWLENAP